MQKGIESKKETKDAFDAYRAMKVDVICRLKYHHLMITEDYSQALAFLKAKPLRNDTVKK